MMYGTNSGVFTESEYELLRHKRIFIAGCGGLGGYVAEFCLRSGIENISLCDDDVFTLSNLNRQRFATTESISKEKCLATREQLLKINPRASICCFTQRLNCENAESLLSGHDLVFDALDNVPSRLCLERQCENQNTPFIYGAVDMWFCQVSSVYPGDRTVRKLYENREPSKPSSASVLAVANTAALQVCEGINVLFDRPQLRKKLLLVNLLDFEAETVAL